jgi:hypothetical protein
MKIKNVQIPTAAFESTAVVFGGRAHYRKGGLALGAGVGQIWSQQRRGMGKNHMIPRAPGLLFAEHVLHVANFVLHLTSDFFGYAAIP